MSMDDLRHPDCRYCDEYERVIKGKVSELAELKKQLRDTTNPTREAVSRPSTETSARDSLSSMGEETGMPEMPLDAGIRPYVEALQTSSVETFESCEGGEDHAFLEPTIRFFGNTGEGFRALGVALGLGLPVAELRREWPVLDGEPTGPYWSMTFSHPARSVSGKEQEGER